MNSLMRCVVIETATSYEGSFVNDVYQNFELIKLFLNFNLKFGFRKNLVIRRKA